MPGRPLRVMVVDDHPIWREALERDLRTAGLEVVGGAGDGEQALRRLPAARPDVVVLDLRLPVLDGVETTRRDRRRAPRRARARAAAPAARRATCSRRSRPARPGTW